MSLTNKIKVMEFPNFNDILKSSKNAKNKINNMDMNKVQVNFYYADNRFKTSVEGQITHESEIPIVYIDYPEKLAFLVPEKTLVYDVKNQTFEISVNEKYTHAVEVTDTKVLHKDVEKFILPIFPETLDYKLVSVESVKDKRDNNITLTGRMLSSLGRAKVLERTLETSNDGLMIMGLIGALVGFCLGLIINLKG